MNDRWIAIALGALAIGHIVHWGLIYCLMRTVWRNVDGIERNRKGLSDLNMWRRK